MSNGERSGGLTGGVTPAEYLRALRRRWPVVVLLTALVLGAALLVSLSATKQYEATAELLFNRSDPVQALVNPNAGSGSSDVERDLNTQVELIKLDSIARRVRERLRLQTTNGALLDQVSTDSSSTSDIVAVKVLDPNPVRAARIANAFANEYVDFRLQSARRNITDAAELAEQQFRALSSDDQASDEGRQLQARQRELEIAAALQTGGVEVVRRASAPGAPARPRPKLSAAIGLLLGLLLGAAAALGLEFADRRLKDEDSFEETFGLPIISVIPRSGRRRGPLADDHALREAYGLLAANLRFAHGDQSSNAVMVTSPSPEEGKTSVTLGLARALARLGLRVLAIEGDLRRPAFADYLGLPPGGGLTELLGGSSQLTDEITWLDATDLQPLTLDGVGEGMSFAVLPAGGIPTNPQRLLARPAMAAVMETARALVDVVIVDTPPIGSVNDAITLSRVVDRVLIVGRLNKTTKDGARRALRVLNQLDVDVLGLVVTDADQPSREHEYYSEPSPRVSRRDTERTRARSATAADA